MVKGVGLAIVMGLLLASCSAGGGALSVGSRRWQAFWPEQGVDRYEAVVYPAEGRP